MPRTDISSPGQRETLVESAARTTNGNTGPIVGWGAAKTIRAQLNATALTGITPTLDVVIEDTLDGGATWNALATFTQIASVPNRQVVNITSPFSDTLRVRWTIGGTGSPSATFAVDCYSE